MNALGTVGTVFRAGSSFDAAQGTKLNSMGVMVLPMDALCLKQQIWQGLMVDLSDAFNCPGQRFSHCEGSHSAISVRALP
jgi:hypothetical protein